MRILITGIAGSIGGTFANYLKEHEVFGIDSNEWAVAEFKQKHPDIKVLLEDFVEWKFDQDPADLVIHCAAYKHVNLGEENINSFIDNNIIKTRKLFAEAYKHNTDILFISTDKAVEPISLYGYTKAIGEKLAFYYNGKVARLGNVLNSSGSVIPVWEQVIRENKPLPVTDIKMKRYVIELDDAVNQIWQQYQEGNQLIIPKCRQITMIELIKVVMDNHELKDYPIQIIGKRKGEKIEEKMRWDDE